MQINFNLKPLVILSAFAIVLLSFISLNKSSVNQKEITVEELNKISLEELIGSTAEQQISFCEVSVELANKDITVFEVRYTQVSPTLRKALSEARPGQMITVEKRTVLENGKEKKLPSIIYLIVAPK